MQNICTLKFATRSGGFLYSAVGHVVLCGCDSVCIGVSQLVGALKRRRFFFFKGLLHVAEHVNSLGYQAPFSGG